MEIKQVTGAELLSAIRNSAGLLDFAKKRHPEQAEVFRKYGTPDEVAARICSGMAEIFFENQHMCMTEQFLLEKNDPDSLLLLKDICKAYPMKSGEKEYLMAEDASGRKYRYSFAVGQKQVFRIGILLDKIRKAAPNCRIREQG